MKLGLARVSFLGFAAILAFHPGQAQAVCGQWDMPERMLIRQSNATNVEATFRPSHGGFIGNASYFSRGRSSTQMVGSGLVTGALEGTIEGANVSFTIHWGYDPHKMVNRRTGIYAGAIGPHGRITGTAYAAENPAESATWWVEEVLRCHAGVASGSGGGQNDTGPRPPPVSLGRVQPTAPPPVSLGRKHSTTPGPSPYDRKQVPMSVILAPPPICVSAQNARGRNSPAAPGLERQCQIAMEQAAAAARAAPPPLPPPITTPSVPSPPPVNNPPVPSGPWPPSSVCDAAREARYNNDPDAYVLESQCRAQGGSVPGPVSNAPGWPGLPQSSPICEAARRARYNNSPDADRLEALCRSGSDVWGQPGRRIPLDYGERSEILDTHNRLRPDFQRLQWDVGLEDSAARSASQMATYGQMMPAQGQNLYMAVPSGRYTFGDVTRIWASERSAFRPGIFPSVTGYGSSAQVTNYTQMIWPDTTHVGCAVERTQRADFFVCRYAPVGNIIGRPVR